MAEIKKVQAAGRELEYRRRRIAPIKDDAKITLNDIHLAEEV